MLSLARPEWLWLLPAVLLFVLVALPTRGCMDPGRWWGALGLRVAVWAGLVFALAQPSFVRRHEDMTVLFAVDRSRSIPSELQDQARRYVSQTVSKARPGDRVGIISFGSEAQVDQVPAPARSDGVRFGLLGKTDQTDIAKALSLARAAFPPDTTRRIVLLTDGNETTGSVLDEVAAAKATGIAVDVVPLEYGAANEIWVDRLVAPDHVRPETRTELRVVVRSRRPGFARLTWYHNNRLIRTTDPVLQLTGGGQADVAGLAIELRDPGAHLFEVRLTPADGTDDFFVENNRGSAVTFVEGAKRILVLDASPAKESRLLAEALGGKYLDVVHKSLQEITVDLLSLQQFAAVVLGNIPAHALNTDQHAALASYVRDLGGGLLLTGGDESFGAGGWTGTALEAISPLAFALPPQKMPLPSALVIVLDRSGSMGAVVEPGPETQQQVANAATTLAVRSLLPIDHVGLVAFDSQPEWIVPLQRNRQPAEIERQIGRIGPRGGTDVYPALEQAVEALAGLGRSAAVRHIILLSDGQTSAGPFDELVTRMVDQGITLSVIGIGNAMNDPMLRRLAERGRGQYHPVADPRVLPRVFFRETSVFRERLVVADTFVPQVSAPTSPLLAGFHRLEFPPLDGYVRTQPKADAVVALEYRGKDRSDPVLAHWHHGMGKVAAFTSGWWPHWATKWQDWPALGQFCKQAVDWVMSTGNAEGFEVTTRVDGDRARVHVEALAEDLGYINALDVRGTVVTPSLQRETIRLKQTAAGRYEAEFAAGEPGHYLIGLSVVGPYSSGGRSGADTMIRTGLSVSYSPEYRNLQAHTALLAAAAARSGGKIRKLDAASMDDLFERDLPPVTSHAPIWKWVLMFVVLPLFLLDVAARRLASPPALSIYVELAVLAMLIGCCQLLSTGLWSYVLALVLAEVVGWFLRWPLLEAALGTGRPTHGQAAAARAEALRRLKHTHEQQRAPDKLAPPLPRVDPRPLDLTSLSSTGETPLSAKPAVSGPDAPKPTSPDGPSQHLTGRLRNAKKRANQRWQ